MRINTRNRQWELTSEADSKNDHIHAIVIWTMIKKHQILIDTYYIEIRAHGSCWHLLFTYSCCSQGRPLVCLLPWSSQGCCLHLAHSTLAGDNWSQPCGVHAVSHSQHLKQHAPHATSQQSNWASLFTIMTSLFTIMAALFMIIAFLFTMTA